MSKKFVIRIRGFFNSPTIFRNVIDWEWTLDDNWLIFTITTSKHKRKFFIRKESVEYFGEKEEIDNG